MPTLVYKLKEVSEELNIPARELTILVRYILYDGKKIGVSYRISRNQINKIKKSLKGMFK